jgi:pyruvate kinase
MLRRTKIVATLGPATDDEKMIRRIVRAGVDIVRLNFSHGAFEEHRDRADIVRESARDYGRQVGVLVDLQGPKIRIDRFCEGKVVLKDGDPFCIDSEHPADGGNQTCVGTVYKDLPKDVKSGDTLILDDGRIVMEVVNVEDTRVNCTVTGGGILSDKKGINLKGGGLSAAALTPKDKQDILSAAALQADYLAVSFPRSSDDIYEARELLRDAGGKGGIVAKIERTEAMRNLEDIIQASDAVMIARGDLGVEIGDEALPPAQKMIIQMARKMNRAVITATQMMESMIYSPIPTRAEVFDVANAVMDGTDAVMLSGETAVGQYPDKVIEAMARICVRAEMQRTSITSDHRINTEFKQVEEAVAMATMYAANHLRVKAIAALTESGSTALWMSRISSGIPIYAMSRQVSTRRRVTLYRGVYPMSFDVSKIDNSPESDRIIIKELRRWKAVDEGDLVIITRGDRSGVGGGTNNMKIVRVGSESEEKENRMLFADK